VLAVLVACGDATVQPTTPRPSFQPAVQRPTPRPLWLGCPNGDGRLYQEAQPIYAAYYASQSGIVVSQYTLCANGTFDLEFESGIWGVTDYLGSYSQDDFGVTFNFTDTNLAGSWVATGQFHGDTLAVVYNNVMMMADFVNGAYVRQSP
jgi:hypothetical protein